MEPPQSSPKKTETFEEGRRMFIIQLGIAGGTASGWAYQGRRDGHEPETVISGSVNDTQNRTLLYAANRILEKLGKVKPSECGVSEADGVNVTIQASQSYLINGMNGRDNGNANRDLWDVLFATRDQRSSEGFVFRWQHIPGTENAMREPASRAANETTPISLSPPKVDVAKRAPWEADDDDE
jgi:hypothetical protein